MDEKDLEEVFPQSDEHGGYQAYCSEHSPHWHGECRANNYEAFEDAKSHDRSAHSGEGKAKIQSSCSVN